MSEFDGPWKLAIERFLETFMLFFFVAAHAEIDWARGYESLDKELLLLFPDGATGGLSVDLLFKVWLKSGEEKWMLIHIEVQSQVQAEFPKRVFQYQYRGFDRYGRPIASFAVLADASPDWRPNSFGYNELGSRLSLEFPIAKLLDIPEQDLLEKQPNPIALLVLAHRKAQETHGDYMARSVWKLRLIRGLYEGGMRSDDAREMLRIVDWMIDLPAPLQLQFWQNVKEIEQEKQMQYLMYPERVAMDKGRSEGQRELIEIAAKTKFSESVAANVLAHLGESPTPDLLKRMHLALLNATSVEELSRQLTIISNESKRTNE